MVLLFLFEIDKFESPGMKNEVKTIICQRIRKLRKRKGLSQQETADLLNMSQSAYSDLETGKTAIDVEKLSRIAEVFQYPLTQLIAPPPAMRYRSV